jgi:adenine-specific DNA-methyltransferase
MRRKFFTERNARRIDKIRIQIAEWASACLVSEREEAYLIASLLNAADAVANTAGTYYAYLKVFYRKAKQPVQLLPLPIHGNGKRNSAHLADAVSLTKRTATDVLYLDPPYNERDYGAYYHLTETIARWDCPEPNGKSGIPMEGRPKSSFCSSGTAESEFKRLLSAPEAKLILVHYSVHGLVPHSTVMECLTALGPTSFHTWQVRKYSTSRGEKGSSGHRLYVCKPH